MTTPKDTVEELEVGTREYLQRKLDRNFEWAFRVIHDDSDDVKETIDLLRTNVLSLLDQSLHATEARVRTEILTKDIEEMEETRPSQPYPTASNGWQRELDEEDKIIDGVLSDLLTRKKEALEALTPKQ